MESERKEPIKIAAEEFCIVIATYNNDRTLESVIEGVLRFTDRVIIINDGSTDSTVEILKKYSFLKIISYEVNRGKGYALRQGFSLAASLGFKYALTIDSDGQHNTYEIPELVNCIPAQGDIMVLGERNMDGEGVPLKSNFGRKFSNFWFWFETGISMKDTQTGFRLYPLDIIKNMRFFTNKFEFEIESLVRIAWKGCPIHSVPVSVRYFNKEERVSHFRPFMDFSRISLLNTVLVTITLLYHLPLRYIKKLSYSNIRTYFREHVLHSKTSSIKLSLSVALGVFVGILPIWGYQLITAVFLAALFKLNKTIAFTASNISITPMIPLILYSSIYVGGVFMGRSTPPLQLGGMVKFEIIKQYLLQYIVGSVLLAAIAALFLGVLSYIIISAFRGQHKKKLEF